LRWWLRRVGRDAKPPLAHHLRQVLIGGRAYIDHAPQAFEEQLAREKSATDQRRRIRQVE